MEKLQNMFYDQLEVFFNENQDSLLLDGFDVEKKINNIITISQNRQMMAHFISI